MVTKLVAGIGGIAMDEMTAGLKYPIVKLYGGTLGSGALSMGSDAAGASLTINPTLGPELLTNGGFDTDLTGWTPGAVWQWSADGAQKFQDGTSTLAHTAATCVIGTYYKLTFDMLGWTVGSAIVTAGGLSHSAVIGANGSYSMYFRALTTAAPLFTPTSTSRFSIDNVSLKEVTLGELAAFKLRAYGSIILDCSGVDGYGRYIFRGDTLGTLGIYDGTGALAYVKIYDLATTTGMTAGSSAQLGSGGLKLASNKPIAVSSTTAYSGALDTGLSRLSAGVWAVGNGTANDFSGGIKLTTFGMGVTPVGVQTGAAVASDLATCITLANALRAAAIAFGAITTV